MRIFCAPITDEERFHVARLSLFTARLLSEFDAARKSDSPAGQAVDRIVQEQSGRDRITMSKDDNLVNQALFLSMAYVTIVWWTEGFSRDAIAIAVEKRRDFRDSRYTEKMEKALTSCQERTTFVESVTL